MTRPLILNPDRLFSSDPGQSALARRPYAEVAPLPIIRPAGHTDPAVPYTHPPPPPTDQ